MVLHSKSKVFLFGGMRQDTRDKVTTVFSNDQLILYHLEKFNELLHTKKRDKWKEIKARMGKKKIVKATNANTEGQRLMRSYSIGDAGMQQRYLLITL